MQTRKDFRFVTYEAFGRAFCVLIPFAGPSVHKKRIMDEAGVLMQFWHH
jgi:hypothetical protein